MSGPPPTDSRAVWLRSLGWRETDDGWTGPVPTTGGARYAPMSLDDAFDVAVARSVIDKAFRVEAAGGHVRLALPWRQVAPEDREQLEEGRH
jgi:hypothetical protein